MQLGEKLLVISGGLGLGVFFVLFFVLPQPKNSVSNVFTDAYLPMAQNRPTPIIKPLTEPKATLMFVGDIMLARAVEASIAANGTAWPFANLGDLFQDSDLVVGNFEGTVRNARTIEATNQMAFDTTPDNVEMLAKAGFTHLSIANNHADDYGNTVTIQTRQTIIDNGLLPFGDPYQSELYIAQETINNIRISLIGFHAFGEDASAIVKAIKAEKAQGRFVIVYPHWGVEYTNDAPTVEVLAAKLFVAAGADLIIGAHPHVIQNIEVIEGVPVIYSLGNFLFDQDFSAETKRGLAVQTTITDDQIALDFTPVSIVNRQTFPMSKADAMAVCAEFAIDNCQLSVARK